jgi:hypothetical protein
MNFTILPKHINIYFRPMNLLHSTNNIHDCEESQKLKVVVEDVILKALITLYLLRSLILDVS